MSGRPIGWSPILRCQNRDKHCLVYLAPNRLSVADPVCLRTTILTREDSWLDAASM